MRWRWIVQTTGHRLPVMDSLDAWLVGQCASQVLPAVIGGDAARILRLRRYGVPMSVTTVTVIMDRFAGFVVLMILSIISIPVLAYRSDEHLVPHEISWMVFILALLLSVFGLCLRYSSRLPIMRTAPALKPVQQALSRLPTDRLSLLVLGLTSLGTNFTVIVSAYVLGHGINPGIDFPGLRRFAAAGYLAEFDADIDCRMGASGSVDGGVVWIGRYPTRRCVCHFSPIGNCQPGPRIGGRNFLADLSGQNTRTDTGSDCAPRC